MRWQTLIAFGGAVIAASCTEPNRAHVPTFAVTFQNTETFSLGGAGCVGNPDILYCGTWNSDSNTFHGTLLDNPATMLTVSGAQYARQSDPGGFVATGSICHFYVITVQESSGSSMSGTFREHTDCHEGGRRGTFTAFRSDLPD